MNSGDKPYIWQQDTWPQWTYALTRLATRLAQVHHAQGLLLGRMHDIGIEQRNQAILRVLTEDVIKTSEIEGEMLNPESVRSSIARRLGVDIGENSEVEALADRHVVGEVDMVLDATQQHDQALTVQRLCGWHAALFPTGYSGMTPNRLDAWRNDAQGPMQVVSGPLHRPRVHYQAPPCPLMVCDGTPDGRRQWTYMPRCGRLGTGPS